MIEFAGHRTAPGASVSWAPRLRFLLHCRPIRNVPQNLNLLWAAINRVNQMTDLIGVV